MNAVASVIFRELHFAQCVQMSGTTIDEISSNTRFILECAQTGTFVFTCLNT